MDFKDCIKFANDVKNCSFATIDNGNPRVRVLSMWFADETGFYLQTESYKDFYKQLKANPKVEMCFWKPEATGMMRVEGEIEFLHDKNLKEKILKDRPFLKTFGYTADSPKLILFRLAKGQAHFWTMQNKFKPKQMIKFG